jgi:hypothetical protein
LRARKLTRVRPPCSYRYSWMNAKAVAIKTIVKQLDAEEELMAPV